MNRQKLIIIILVAAALIVVVGALRFFSGDEDTWLCQNGQWVKHGVPNAPMPSSGCGSPTASATPAAGASDIKVFLPQPQAVIKSPLIIEGSARGNWFFEATAPVRLLNEQDKELAAGTIQATGDWMTTDFVPFKGELKFDVSTTSSGTLIFNNDNPSGLPQNNKEYRVPVVISPSDMSTIYVYFNNNKAGEENFTCNAVTPVQRAVPETPALARAALEELLKGPSEQEKSRGYFNSINSGVKIQKLTIENGTAKVDFDEQLEFQVGGSCRVAAIRAQITETLKQFPRVKDVIISIDGRTEDILQP